MNMALGESYTFCIEIAGYVIEIVSNYKFSKDLFSGFLTDKKSDFRIELGNRGSIIKNIIYRNGQMIGQTGTLDFTEMHRIVSESLIEYRCFLMHGAVIALHGNAYMFTAKSGTGKTTHINKWLANCKDAYIVDDDKPYIKIDEVPMACGAPWTGKEGKSANSIVPLKAIVILQRSEENSINSISFLDAFPYLYQQIYKPGEISKMKKTLQMLCELEEKVSFYLFRINNYKDDCFRVAYEALIV